MREEKEIRKALKRLKAKHLRRLLEPGSSSSIGVITERTIVDTLEWVLGDKKRLPDDG